MLTGKQLLFAEPIIRELRRNNDVWCTVRNYRELNELVKIRQIRAKSVGRHGGKDNLSKLVCSTRRIEILGGLVKKFQPKLVISFQSPDAARVAFGLGIRHIGFADSSHASAVMKLTIPYLDKLLIPWIMSKEKFARYGIDKKDILHYRAIDAAITSRRNFTRRLKLKKNTKVVLIRMAEEHASYNEFPARDIIAIIRQILKCLPEFKVIVLARYAEQIKLVKKQFGQKVTIIEKVPDGRDILRYADVFIGSGGTMTAEAAFLGIPTISYSTRRDYEVDAFLEEKKVVIRESRPEKISSAAKLLTETDDQRRRERIRQLLKTMEDPFQVLQKAIKS